MPSERFQPDPETAIDAVTRLSVVSDYTTK